MNQRSPSPVIALPSTLTTAAGAIVYWRLSGTMESEALYRAWTRAGFDADELPSTVSPLVALKRAIEWDNSKELDASYMVKPLSTAEGYAVLERHEELDSDGKPKQTWAPFFSAALGAGRVKVWSPEGTSDESSRQSRLTDRLDVELDLFHAHDISTWLVKQIATFQAVSLRDTGGFYFIPAPMVDRWNTFAEVVHEASQHMLMSIPAMTSKQASLAVITALMDEVTDTTARYTASLEEGKSKRWLDSRGEKLGELLDKVEMYEGAVGQKLDDLRAELTVLRAKFVTAAMAVAV